MPKQAIDIIGLSRSDFVKLLVDVIGLLLSFAVFVMWVIIVTKL